MAKITFEGFESYKKQLEELGRRSDAIIKPAVYDGAAVLAEEVKRSLRRVLSDKATGDLVDSLGLTKMVDEQGYVYTKLGFVGYDRKKAANMVKAQVLERGRRDQPKRIKKPFMSAAIRAAKAKTVEAMDATCNDRVQKIMEKTSKEA